MKASSIIFGKVKKRQLFVMSIGAVVGFLFLFLSVHYFFVVRELFSGDEFLNKNLVVAQKKVTKYSALNENSTLFTDEEIDLLKDHPAVEKLETVVNNQFSVALSMKEEGLPYFSTDIFIQSVTNDLLDLSSASWSWQEQDEFVPLVMPRDFMLMLNQFASSYKIPQISEEIAQTLNFKLKLKSRGQYKEFNAKIIGFSNQMNSVLVPMEFMNYGNENFSSQQELPISQLVLKMKESEYGDFETLVDDLNIDIKANELFVVKIQGILYVALTILVLVALLILVLCSLMIWQFSLLLMSQSAYEIQTLLRIGYHPNFLAHLFFRFYLRLFSIVLVLAFLIGIAVKYSVDQQLMNFGFRVLELPKTMAFVLAIVIAGTIILLNLQSVRGKLKKSFNS